MTDKSEEAPAPSTSAVSLEKSEEGEVPSALARKRQERKEENRREKQRQLDWLFREVEISWDQVVKFMRFDDLQPNIKEAGTGITSLHRASSAGQADVLQWCIRTKAEIDCCTQMGRSALHYACECSRPRCVRILLDHKADANLRTLSYLTPLHLACQANSVEAVTVLLENANQVVDVDAEDTKGRSAEALSNDQQIHKLVRKYRAQLDERRKVQLVEQCLLRLFNFFDVNQDGMIHPEEWIDSMLLLAEFFEHHSDQSIQKMFEDIDKDDSGYIDWAEFKASYAELLQVINVPFRELMDMLADIDRAILQEKLRLDREATKEAEARASKVRQAAAEEVRNESDDDEETQTGNMKIEVTHSEVSVAGASTVGMAVRRFQRSPVLSPKAKAMSLRRVAIRRHSDHNVAETAEEAMATLAQQAVSDKLSENPRASSPLEDEEKENVLPPTTDLDTDGLSAESEKSEKLDDQTTS